MTWIIILAALTMLALALFMAYVLGWASRAFHVPVDPKVEQVTQALPGANCGGCGFLGCADYAEAVVAGKASIQSCPVGGPAVAAALAAIMNVEVSESAPMRAVVHCGADASQRLGRVEYRGEQTCAAAHLVGGAQACSYGCMGLGDCVTACKFDAIHVVNGLAVVDYDKCVGCGACVKACPRGIISMAPFKAGSMLTVACSNKDFGKDVKAVCTVGCIGCKACQRNCDLFNVTDNLPKVDYDRYDAEAHAANLQTAAEKCPTKCLLYRGTR